MCMGSVGYVVGGCNVQCTCCTEHGRYGLSCLYAEMESMSSARWVCMVYMLCMVHMYMICLICWSLSYVVKLFYCCWTCMLDMDQ